MAQGDLEVVRRIYDAWGAGDFSVGLEDLDHHVCFVVTPPFPSRPFLAFTVWIDEALPALETLCVTTPTN